MGKRSRRSKPLSGTVPTKVTKVEVETIKSTVTKEPSATGIIQNGEIEKLLKLTKLD